MSSSNHDDLAHLKIPLQDILSATDNFSDKNLIETTGFGNVYKGQLSWSGELININAQRIKKERNEAEQEFWMEISMLASLKHKNLVSLVGFCDEKDEKIIIYINEARGWLDTYLSNSMSLTWLRRLEICVGLAHALSYIHYDEPRDFSVIHRSLCSATVQLNDDWEPKLSRFERSMKIEASQRDHSIYPDTLFYLNGYEDTTFMETRSVNHKSDIYSFGIVLFEVLCGRSSIINDDINKYLAPLAITHYREQRLDEIIDWGLLKEMDSQSLDIFAKTAYDCLNEERSLRPNIDEIVARLEKALELQLEHQNEIMSSPSKEFSQLRVPFENILSATNNFSDENFLGKTRFEKRYWGQLLWSGELIKIQARRWLNEERDDEKEQQFWMEISMLSSLKHKNLASIVGFCDENDEKIIIYRYETRGGLTNYLSDPMLLTWVRRLEISVGVAHALSYIHYDEPRDFSVIHRYLCSAAVLLNDDWEPRLTYFNSIRIKASHRHRSFQNYNLKYVNGYGDPTYIETKIVNHKSDMYSFGMVLFELLCGRESVIEDQDNKYLGPMVIFHYREKRLDEIIDWDLLKQMDSQSLDIFAKTAYDCLNEERSLRPNIDEIVTRLEKALKLQLEHQNEIMSSPSKEYAHLIVPLENILSATNNFAQQNFIGKTRFEKRYRGQLLWTGELIKIQARRWLNEERDDEKEKQFWMEISMLSSLKHKNLASIVGFCDENDEKIIIYRQETRGSLTNYLSDPILLTWVRRLEICVGVAHALSYIHYDEPRDFSVIHRYLCSDAILLNDDWEPKLSYFDSMRIKASLRHRSFQNYNPKCVNGYGDPTYIKTKSVSHKSDMYSFGIVLFELLFGRRSIIDDQDNKYLAPVAIFHYKKKILDELIDPALLKQMDPQSFNVFAKTAYDCLNKERSRRPDISEVVTILEEALKLHLACKNSLEQSIVATEVEGTSSNRDKESMTFISTNVESHVRKKTMSSSKDLSNLKLSFQDIASATNNFAHENTLGQSKLVYIGRLLHSEQFIDIIVRRFPLDYAKDESKRFWMEVSLLSSLKHKNLVSLIGFYEDAVNKIIIYKKDFIQSLEKYLSDPTLTWMQRLKICISVAKTLNYIHYDPGRDFSVIHCNIASGKIALDNDREPKLSGFDFSLKNTVARRHRLVLTRDIVKSLYMDPKYEKTGGVTHKSDVYSFGVVLFEVFCGRSAAFLYEKLGEGFLSKLGQYNFADISPHIRKQMDPESLKIFLETASCCIKEERADRPYIDQVVKRLEKAFELQWKHENPDLSRKVLDGTSSNHFKGKNLDHLKIRLNDIIQATNTFDEACCIGSGGFGKVYKADLEHFDSSNSSLIEGMNKCDLPKKRSTIAIKRIHNPKGEQGFITEI